jgi:hypothetical protein
VPHICVVFTFNSSNEDGTSLLCQLDAHICCQRIVFSLRNMFKFLGHTQFLEICATAKKVMLFMIMVLSCCDLLSILATHPLMTLLAMLWLTGTIKIRPDWVGSYLWVSEIFLTISFLALLVLNFERYLATYPLFHRTSITRGRHSTLLATRFFSYWLCGCLWTKTSFPIKYIFWLSSLLSFLWCCLLISSCL